MRRSVVFLLLTLSACVGETFSSSPPPATTTDGGDEVVDAADAARSPYDAGAYLPLPPTCMRASCSDVFGYTATAECGQTVCNAPSGCHPFTIAADAGTTYVTDCQKYASDNRIPYVRPEIFECVGDDTPTGCVETGHLLTQPRSYWCCP